MLLFLVFAFSAQAGDEQAGLHRVVGLLEYIEGDWAGAIASNDADELTEQEGLADEAVRQLEAMGPRGARWLERARAVKAAVGSRASDVPALCAGLARDIVSTEGLSRAPVRAPSLEKGAALFQANCASCHGVKGDADTPLARTLTPKPASFVDAERMRTLTPYKVFNTTTFGIKGTPMPAFPSLSADERWALAFHVFTLRQPACDHQPARLGIDELATSTDDALASRHGERELACLRRRLPEEDGSSLLLAVRGLDDAVRLSAQGQHDAARQAVVDAYLLGLEPVEPTLRARDPELVGALEQGFTRARLAAQRGEGLEAEAKSLRALLTHAQQGSARGDFWAVFVAAMLILMREGFEAVIVVVALLAVMKKMKAEAEVRVVHAGWISALVFGAVAFAFGQAFFAGANREWLEALVALAAVGLLLYAALWLNARANVSRYMGELRAKMSSVLGTGNTAGLFVIAFTSAGRESLETALFLQGLAGDSRAGVTWGALAGLAALLMLVLVVRRVGFVLPMKTLFSASTVLLLATAVMLLGKGLHGLQELGVVSLHPVPFVTIDPLGVYPDLVSLGAQVVLALLATAWLRGWFRGAGRADTDLRPAPEQ